MVLPPLPHLISLTLGGVLPRLCSWGVCVCLCVLVYVCTSVHAHTFSLRSLVPV